MSESLGNKYPSPNSRDPAAPSLEETLMAAPIPELPAEGSALRSEIERIAEERGQSPLDVRRDMTLNNRELLKKDWTSTGVSGDAMNIWTATVLEARRRPGGGRPNIKPIRLYDDYIVQQYSTDQPSLDYVRNKSNPQTVAEADALAHEFNEELDRLREENDVDKILEYARRAYKIFRGAQAPF